MKNLDIQFFKISFIASIIIIYYQIYSSFWFVNLLNGYQLNAFVPIAFLLLVPLIEFFLRKNTVKNLSLIKVTIPILGLYLTFSICAVILNERTFDQIITYLVYLFSPIIIFFGIVFSNITNSEKGLNKILNVMMFSGIFLSLYVMAIYSIESFDPNKNAEIMTNRGLISSATGASFGIENIGQSIRWAIPGMSSPTYGGLLIPLFFIIMYFRKLNINKTYFYDLSLILIFYSILKTISRGPIVSLMIGVCVLIVLGYFSFRQVLAILLISAIGIGYVAKILLYRVLMTLTALFPGIDVFGFGRLLYEERFESIGKSIAFFFGKSYIW